MSASREKLECEETDSEDEDFEWSPLDDHAICKCPEMYRLARRKWGRYFVAFQKKEDRSDGTTEWWSFPIRFKVLGRWGYNLVGEPSIVEGQKHGWTIEPFDDLLCFLLSVSRRFVFRCVSREPPKESTRSEEDAVRVSVTFKHTDGFVLEDTIEFHLISYPSLRQYIAKKDVW